MMQSPARLQPQKYVKSRSGSPGWQRFCELIPPVMVMLRSPDAEDFVTTATDNNLK